MQPVLTWMGNKRLMTKKLLPLIPDHITYCEPFAGSAALLLAKPPSRVEVLNDLDSELVNFYRVARHHQEALVDELEWMPRAREEFEDALSQPGLTDIQRAARWLFLNKYSFGGKGETWGRGRDRPPLSRKNLIANIYALAERLHDVVLENRDWRDVVSFYDGPETFFFVDPPYVDTEHYASMDAGWGESEHAELADALRSSKGAWLLTYNNHPLVRELYDGCGVDEVSQSHSMPKKGKMGEMRQLVIRNTGARALTSGT